jgi:putative Holliday junction resolvase
VTPAGPDAGAGRVVALDYGSGRCGVAVSDPTGTLATPLDAIERPGTRKGFNRLLAAIRAQAPVVVVVGLPISLGGGDTAQTAESRAFADRLAGFLDVPVELYDERFTTRMAQQRAGSAAEDSRAAAVLLEGWLNRKSRFGPDRAI